AMNYIDAAETLKKWIAALFKGTPEEKPEQYAVSSPISYVEYVSAPILIIQGLNDTRTPARQVRVYEKEMQKYGKLLEVHWFDAGHLAPFAQVEQAVVYQEHMLRFANRILNIV
ncbi:MAG TPA: prolyl oligopeptidase family serine peptidase, partial [Ktedonobacteraceae bacterium]|nr:prolyl oligopeptidase family serine peptidase [Ktedonobacteraceae bacterium]